MKGIDISSYQKNVDFNQVKNDGVEIVILKASEGRTWQDPTFREKYNGAKSVGLKVGFYHFLRGNAPIDEVNNFLSVINGLNSDCKLIIDAEVNEATSSQIKAFYDILTSKGYEVALYTYESFYNSKLDNSVKNIPLWIAKYSSNKPNVPSYIGWQYADNGSVAGISGNVDMNDFNEGIFVGNNSVAQSNPQTQVNTNNNEKYPLLSTYNRNVKLFQQACNAMDITGKNGKPLTEDGEYGENTDYAVHSTKAMLIRGMKNPLVGAMQFMFGLKVDNCYGDDPYHETYDMIGEFQESKNLEVDHIVGFYTWIELFKAWR